MVIGLTGGIGSGKTTVANFFSKFENIIVYNADDQAKKLMNTSLVIKESLINEFGKNVYVNESLNRPYLANIVFNNKQKLNTLNKIVHPIVNENLQNFIKNYQNKKHILYENAILFENNNQGLCRKVITVTAPIDIRIDRIIKRDGSTYEHAKKRIQNQWKDSKKTLQSHYIIQNINILDTETEALKVYNFLTKQ